MEQLTTNGEEIGVSESTLTPEQKNTVNNVLYLLKRDLITDSKMKSFELNMDNFGQSLKDKGLNPDDYYLWYKISRSTLPKDTAFKYFDTEDGEIEKFIKDNLGGDITGALAA